MNEPSMFLYFLLVLDMLAIMAVITFAKFGAFNPLLKALAILLLTITLSAVTSFLMALFQLLFLRLILSLRKVKGHSRLLFHFRSERLRVSLQNSLLGSYSDCIELRQVVAAYTAALRSTISASCKTLTVKFQAF